MILLIVLMLFCAGGAGYSLARIEECDRAIKALNYFKDHVEGFGEDQAKVVFEIFDIMRKDE